MKMRSYEGLQDLHAMLHLLSEGEVASFCIVWTDPITKVGHFEPVATHPNYQGKGLGKCLLHEGFRRLAAEGMQEADLCNNFDHPAAHGLYEAVGLRITERLLTYIKRK